MRPAKPSRRSTKSKSKTNNHQRSVRPSDASPTRSVLRCKSQRYERQPVYLSVCLSLGRTLRALSLGDQKRVQSQHAGHGCCHLCEMTSGVFASLNSSFSHLLFCKSESGFARVAIGNRSVKPPREDRTGLGRQNIIVGGKAPSASPIAVFAECENWTRRGRPMRGRMSRSFRFLWRQVKLLTAAVRRSGG